MDSVELWIHLLAYYVDFDSLEMAIEVFQTGVRSLTKNSLPLWEIIILYMQNTHPKLVRLCKVCVLDVSIFSIENCN